MILIICEKPSQALDYANVLNARPRDGYFESEKYLITYASGHLYELYSIEDYTNSSGIWSLDALPFIPDTFKWKPIKDGKEKIVTIKTLMKRAKLIIDAMDYDREAELIFYEIDADLQFQVPIKRLLITSYTEKDILFGLTNLKNRLIGLEKAAVLRAKMDWIIGKNFTRTFTLKSGNNQPLPIGRVLLATLYLLYKRVKDIESFKVDKFYTLEADFSFAHSHYKGVLIKNDVTKKFFDKKEIEKLSKALKESTFSVQRKEFKKTKEYPGRLYSLSLLQKEITNSHKEFTSDQVAKIVQKLYEEKYTTYPRTDSKYLNNTQVHEAKQSLYLLCQDELFSPYKKYCIFHQNKRTFNSEKVFGHPAIIPTGKIPDIKTFSEKEKMVYLAISHRFLMHFMRPAVYEERVLITSNGEELFKSKEKELISLGWKVLLEKDLNSGEMNLLEISKNDKVEAVFTIKSGKTSPPSKYREGDLINEMLTCGEKNSEEKLLQGYTVGTASTRAATIKKLIDYGYAKKKGLQMEITNLGNQVIENFPIKEILDVSFTGRIEKVLKQIENGQVSDQEFLKRIEIFIRGSVDIMKKADIPIIEKEYEKIMKCPECKDSILDMPGVYKCENEMCHMILYKNDKTLAIYKKSLTKTAAKKLIKDKKLVMKGLTCPKKGLKFEANVNLEADNKGNYSLKVHRIEE